MTLRTSTSRTLLLLCTLFGSASCEALFGGLSKGNPESCVATPDLCQTPDEVCNSETRACEPALRIDSLTPSAAPYGQTTAVTVTGKNFVANMTLHFADQAATIQSLVSESQLAVTAPASSGSTAPVTLDLVSPSSQRLRVEGMFHYFPWPMFGTPAVHNIPSTIKTIRSGDINQDGRPDLVLTGDSAVPVSVFFGQANGTLLPGPGVAFASRPFGMAIGDVNDDGKLDIVVSETGPQPTVEIALGKGDGTFVVMGSVQVGSTTGAIALVDATSDRKADIVVGDGTNIVVYPSLGNGMFAAPIKSPHTNQPMDAGSLMATGDFNEDGRTDVVLSNSKDTGIPIFQNNGNGTFTQLKSITYSKAPTQPTVADVNKDGHLDLVLAVKSAEGLLVYLGNGTGGFTHSALLSTFASTDTISVGDMNGDGTADIVTVDTNGLGENFDIQAGYGNGQFLRSTPYFISSIALAGAIYVGDLTADGKPDVAIAQRTGKLSIYKNVTP